MDINEINILLNIRNGNFAELKKLIVSMNLIPSLPKNQFDLLTERILKQLEKGSDYDQIKQIIENELIVTYGLYRQEFNSEKITDDIFDWWEKN
ncbi:hypothetical protein [Chryseobacterium limigenitum]|uniref:Uncharacterized protein n=1 Tax=Chryseobacterium limigenitum TaxID=1612149 RepID=A0A1K2IV48_9FLAO|nr:hypothetical protein [Chryseobacterium limigenitum]SFZ96239.1 hypothetical protein SAMN05216324_11753 [Chryseobacterium limigenitum]